MASSWVKSLHCKSQACADVYHPTNLPHSGCTKSLRNLKDVVEKPKRKKHQKQRCAFTPNQQETRVRVRVSDSIPTPTTDSCFPTLTELSEGHSSRNIVEIIFYNSWNRSQSASSASKIELLFKVQNLPKTVARFEEYREMVKMKSRARDPGRKDGRCVADGNEVLRFHCAGPAGWQVDAVSRFCSFSGGGTAIRTFSGSGEAHESFGSYKGRRAMLVCRVIAGRVCKNLESYFQGCGFDSVAGENGQLLVFDSTAVLPCFLIIYHF